MPGGVGTALQLTVRPSTRSGHTVFTGVTQKAGCARAIVLDPSLTLAMTAQNPTADSARLCKVADAMFGSALHRVQSGPPDEMTLPADAIARIDFCARLGAAASTFLGSASATPQLHGCIWAHGTTASITATLGIDAWPPGFPPPNAKSVTIGGHPCVTGLNKGSSLSFGINQVQMGHSPLETDRYDVIIVLVSTKNSSDVESKIRTFLSAVAGLA